MTSYTLLNDRIRANAIEAIKRAPQGYRVTISEPKRSLDQNAMMWALLNDVANVTSEYDL